MNAASVFVCISNLVSLRLTGQCRRTGWGASCGNWHTGQEWIQWNRLDGTRTRSELEKTCFSTTESLQLEAYFFSELFRSSLVYRFVETFSVFPFFGLSLHSNESNPCNESSHFMTPIARREAESVNEMPWCQAPSPLLYTACC